MDTEILRSEDFEDRIFEFKKKLSEKYDTSPIKKIQAFNEYHNGRDNFVKTLRWVEDYAKDNLALDSIASGLESLINLPEAGWMAFETRRFLKFSHLVLESDGTEYSFNNIPFAIEFGNLLSQVKKIDKGFFFAIHSAIDDLYWNSEWDTKSSVQEVLEKHERYVLESVNTLKEQISNP